MTSLFPLQVLKEFLERTVEYSGEEIMLCGSIFFGHQLSTLLNPQPSLFVFTRGSIARIDEKSYSLSNRARLLQLNSTALKLFHRNKHN